MAKKTTVKPAEKPDLKTLTVSCKGGRRFRAGLEFGPQPRTIDVTQEQAAQISADPLLKIEN